MIPRALLLSLLVAASAACSRGLPAPTTGPHVGEDPVPVPDEPPPGKVEIVPDQPAGMKHPVWIDGEWTWRGHRWVWKAGGWQDAPTGMYYAPPRTVRLGDGTLVHFGGLWKPNPPAK